MPFIYSNDCKTLERNKNLKGFVTHFICTHSPEFFVHLGRPQTMLAISIGIAYKKHLSFVGMANVHIKSIRSPTATGPIILKFHLARVLL